MILTVQPSTGGNYNISTSAGSATGTITNDDESTVSLAVDPDSLEEDAEGVAAFGSDAPPAPSDTVAGLVAEQASDASSGPVPRDDMGDVIASGSGNSIGSAPAPAPLEGDEGMTMSDASSGSQGAPVPMAMEALGRLDRGST